MLGIAVLFITFCRAAWLGFLVALVILCLIKYKPNFSFSQGISLVFISSIMLSCIYLLKKDSADGRVIIWKSAILGIKSNFINGVGTQSLSVELLRNQSELFKNDSVLANTQGHLAGVNLFVFNDVLEVWLKHGVLGVLFFSLLLFQFFNYAIILYRKEPDTKIIIPILSIIVILVSGLASYPLSVLPITILFSFGKDFLFI